MRYLFGFMCVCALGLMGCSEKAGTGGSGGMGGDGGSGGSAGAGGSFPYDPCGEGFCENVDCDDDDPCTRDVCSAADGRAAMCRSVATPMIARRRCAIRRTTSRAPQRPP